MVAAGEDPRFIARRLIIIASEDVGNADPRALQVAVAAAQALDWVGPARGAVRARPGDGLHRRRAQVEPRRLGLLGGHGRRPRARLAARADAPAQRPVARMRATASASAIATRTTTSGADVDQQYLPDALVERRYYVPGDQGFEPRIGERLDRLRVEREAAGDKGGRERSKGDLPSVDPMRTAGGVMKRRARLARATSGAARTRSPARD